MRLLTRKFAVAAIGILLPSAVTLASDCPGSTMMGARVLELSRVVDANEELACQPTAEIHSVCFTGIEYFAQTGGTLISVRIPSSDFRLSTALAVEGEERQVAVGSAIGGLAKELRLGHADNSVLPSTQFHEHLFKLLSDINAEITWKCLRKFVAIESYVVLEDVVYWAVWSLKDGAEEINVIPIRLPKRQPAED